MQLAHM